MANDAQRLADFLVGSLGAGLTPANRTNGWLFSIFDGKADQNARM